MRLIPSRVTRERFGGISTMSEWRRRRAGLLPPVVTINGRNFDPEHEIEAILAAYAAGATDDDVRTMVARQIEERAAAAAGATEVA
ncbi:MAG: hypothetical protein RLW62_20055 [Gammaproteobacteria bacterium]